MERYNSTGREDGSVVGRSLFALDGDGEGAAYAARQLLQDLTVARKAKHHLVMRFY